MSILDEFHVFETAVSRKAHERKDWDPTCAEYVYSCLLACLNERCNEVVANSGEGFVDVDVVLNADGKPEHAWVGFFSPKYFYPHLKLFFLPKDTPKDVVDEINKSFELIFCNPPSAANHIRMALENLLTYMKVKRYENRRGRKYILNLHTRIELIPVKYQSLKDFCLAIKWLGNAGSHSFKSITFDDVMDAYDIMDEVLRELFERKNQHIKKLVKTINRKKGPKGSK